MHWERVLDSLTAAGWTGRVLSVTRLDEARRRIVDTVTRGGFDPRLASYLGKWAEIELPATFVARSIVIAATPRPLTQASLVWRGAERLIQIPPHYAGYRTLPNELTAAVSAALAPSGHSVAGVGVPLKTLAACSDLARYGRNNVVYVDGLGSYLLLAACVSDAPPPDGDHWTEPRLLERCAQCFACDHACPTGAIRADRFLLHTERCLTLHNEETGPLPPWIDPAWHHAAVGCLRCQLACPENAAADLKVLPPERFDEEETEALLTGGAVEKRPAAMQARLRRCGLDYSPRLIARNLRLLLEPSPR